MDPTRGQGGIQMLLAAEQEAQQIVTAARNTKMSRLRQAKEEAEREVANFRSQMEADYQKHISESSGNSDSTVKRLEAETEEKIKSLKEKASKETSEVTKMLLKYILTVRN
ncbi:V-type proton ATPase subunit G-like [Andrographis paniculata]|uniref:V-type proton ATPase subunit G-like n=1 Tax=Andrographis paniculata TaxID=175694 RepID=UPI0021E8B5CF|nr:V-type proton ATPase subunit G-like [Andrographis paniculata]XP_051124402.1 V-type proton ATPase subunit G-like [Andrographis paniculata]